MTSRYQQSLRRAIWSGLVGALIVFTACIGWLSAGGFVGQHTAEQPAAAITHHKR